MKRLHQIVTVALLLAWLPLLTGQRAGEIDDIREAVRRYGQAEVMISYPGYEKMTTLASRFSVASCDGVTAILSLAPRDVEEFIESGVEWKLVVTEEHKGFWTATSADEAMQWQSYPTLPQYDTIMQRLTALRPGTCRLDTIGYSVMGRAITALRITAISPDNLYKPAVMLSAAMHGDEPAGFVLLMRLAESLITQSDAGDRAEELVNGLEIWINPLANPDGAYRNNDTLIYPVRANSNGYDLNRNFPGPGTGYIEPLQRETADMISFMKDKRIVLSANLHSGAEVVNYPWDTWQNKNHPDDSWFNDVSRRYADTVHLHAPAGYMTFLDNGVTRGWEWYAVSGGRQDYVTWALGGREVTIEIDNQKMTPGTQLETLWQRNHRSLMNFLAEALNGVRGSVTDDETGVPLQAEIYISGHDQDSSATWSDERTGYYSRLLPPGRWELTCNSKGYRQQRATVVLTGASPLLLHHFRLVREEEAWPDPPVKGMTIWPNPSDGHLQIMLPSEMSGEVTVSLITLDGAVVRQYRDNLSPLIPLTCNFSGLARGVYLITVRKEASGSVARGKILILR